MSSNIKRSGTLNKFLHIPKDLSFADSPVFTKGHSQCQVVKTAYQTSQIYYGKRPDFDEMIDFIIGFSAKF
jgi:hypothetical protein